MSVKAALYDAATGRILQTIEGSDEAIAITAAILACDVLLLDPAQQTFGLDSQFRVHAGALVPINEEER